MLRQRPGTESESIINKNNEEPNNKFSDSNPGHFSMVRNFYIADFLTLTNGACGVGTILSLLHYQTSRDPFHLWLAFTLIPIGVFFDVLDGRVARWRNESSLLGQELDSLADLISFGLAPASLGFCLGLNTWLDKTALIYFVLCGLARLARYNATVANLPKHGDGKVKYFEGTPIPTSLILVILLAYFANNGQVDSNLPLGEFKLSFIHFHPLSFIYVLSGSAMISRSLKIPKF